MVRRAAFEHLIHDAVEVAGFVGITGDRGGPVGLLEKTAQAVISFEIGSFNDQKAGQWLARQQRFQRCRVDAAACGDADHLAARKHRHGLQLDYEAIGIGVDIHLVKAEHFAGRLLTLGQELRQPLGALRNQTSIGAEEQEGLEACVGCFEETGGFGRL